MVVLADFPEGHIIALPPVILPTCSRGQVLHHSRQVVTVGVAVAQEEDVLVVPSQPLRTLLREGQSRGLNLTGRAISSGGVALV